MSFLKKKNMLVVVIKFFRQIFFVFSEYICSYFEMNAFFNANKQRKELYAEIYMKNWVNKIVYFNETSS